jgi:hypothetical protein
MLIDLFPFDLGKDDFFAVDATLRQDLSTRGDDETLAPELNPISTRRSLVTDTVHGRNKTAIRDGMTTLHRFPGGMLGVTVFRFLGRMPANGCGIKQYFGTP